MSERKFPIQAVDTYTGERVSVPWSHAEKAYEQYASDYGTSQSLERLAERHGFGASEIVFLLKRIQVLEGLLEASKHRKTP